MMLSVWQPSLIDAHSLIRDNELEPYFIQFLSDTSHIKGFYIVLNNIPSTVVTNLFRKYRLVNGKTKLSYL